ncbi:MAG TPA: tRNA uridine-5-carboxymethylaminomethyl(34) synthesis GTPase MnmE [Roseiflexaceae bacterium]|nr:tRNA uridine-5-carboxymethylaminomethyl(34) synthesis GTPase MnmE [Roseiflexaceae bacterium]
MLYNDTIAAIATPPGVGGIAVVRLSGPDALPILERIFAPAQRGAWKPFRMRFGRVVTPGGNTLDEALVVYMRAPRSFTAEDVVEISCHGGPLIVDRVLALALAAGARPAEPGEFTMRAFLNGRMDLTQAEATLDVINARTETGLALAQAQLGGWLANAVGQIRAGLLNPLAYLTAMIDFPEDDVDVEEIVPPIETALRQIERLRASAAQGMIYRQGARAALVGVPNVGKSSLLNALLRSDRAIVTPIPGTTRDTLEETANIGGIPVVLVDTAGITETNDMVEQIGIERSRAALQSADVALLVRDATRPITDAERELAALTGGKPTIMVLNKTDLLCEEGRTTNDEGTICNLQLVIGNLQSCVRLSALTGAGLDDLTQAMVSTLAGQTLNGDAQLVTNPRHHDALGRAATHLREVLDSYKRGVPSDLLTIDLTAAVSALGEITGEDINDDLLNTIFSKFCIGK